MAEKIAHRNEVHTVDVPWLQARRGKANIMGFFESLAPLRENDDCWGQSREVSDRKPG